MQTKITHELSPHYYYHGYYQKLEILCTAGGNTKWGSHCKTVCSFLKKLNIELPYDLEIPLLGTYPKELKSGY